MIGTTPLRLLEELYDHLCDDHDREMLPWVRHSAIRLVLQKSNAAPLEELKPITWN